MPAEPNPSRRKRPKLCNEYAEIDKQTNNNHMTKLIGNPSDLPGHGMSLLLITIRDHSGGQISYKNITKIFKEHPDLQDKL